ncbi:Meiotic expression up-regulated protein 26 [Cytospora mali]|uniref:Meiotic expression up-regulated protein 26 n=1 Tax=Cytospora mali TaxID=578113 RepID=A0A194VDT2_CYTMA|nr:Meiotic expression up-regulated protein 26 [Valsa mali var. pyri (nom. inval.)]
MDSSQAMYAAPYQMPVDSEGMSAASHEVWTTPTSSGMRPRPSTIHEGFSYCAGESYHGIPAWNSSAFAVQQQQQTPSETVSSRPMSVHQEFYSPTTMEHGQWMQKPVEDNLEMHGIEADGSIGHAYSTDEAIPVLDLRYPEQALDGESMHFEHGLNPRRMSGSSFTMSTSGGLSDMTSYDDFSTALSDALSFTSEYPLPSNRNSLMSSTQLSPVASPRMTPQSRSELVRTQSRGRASPSPRPGLRSAPYSVEPSRHKRWSTGTYGTMQNRRAAPFVYQHAPEACGPCVTSGHSSPTIQNNQVPLNFGNLQATQQQQFFMGTTHPAAFPHNSILLPSQLPSQSFHPDTQQFENPPPLLSHGLFRMLQSNADPHSLHGHYTDLSDPPDLFAALHEEQIPPPPEDMNPSDPDMVPHEQEMRFEGDLYTPKWVRGHGNKREGWCGICKPGRWLVLKNSAFWYDKSFTHGISAATGQPFQEPQDMRRMDGNPDVWEGLCSSCNDWIALVNSKKKGTTWFRHAYKCHTHPKIKDAPKRRRESSHQRLAASTMAKPQVEPGEQPQAEDLTTPQMTPAQITSHPQQQQHHQQKQQQQQY